MPSTVSLRTGLVFRALGDQGCACRMIDRHINPADPCKLCSLSLYSQTHSYSPCRTSSPTASSQEPRSPRSGKAIRVRYSAHLAAPTDVTCPLTTQMIRYFPVGGTQVPVRESLLHASAVERTSNAATMNSPGAHRVSAQTPPATVAICRLLSGQPRITSNRSKSIV